jgi:L-galactose dehydrogenase
VGSVDVILSYCHHTLTDSTLEDLLPYLKQKGVGIINASPLCMGLFTAGGPPAWHPAPENLKVAAKSAAEECAARGVSISKLALQHSIRNPDIATTLVGMCTVDQVNQNCDAALHALGLVLDSEKNLSNTTPREEEEALDAMQSILAPVKNISWSSGRPENN